MLNSRYIAVSQEGANAHLLFAALPPVISVKDGRGKVLIQHKKLYFVGIVPPSLGIFCPDFIYTLGVRIWEWEWKDSPFTSFTQTIPMKSCICESLLLKHGWCQVDRDIPSYPFTSKAFPFNQHLSKSCEKLSLFPAVKRWRHLPKDPSFWRHHRSGWTIARSQDHNDNYNPQWLLCLDSFEETRLRKEKCSRKF